MTEAEQHQLVIEWNDTKTDYPRSKTIPQLFEEQVERTANATSVVFEDQQLSYGELERRSNQLAQQLRSQGVGTEMLVGVCLERSEEMVVAMLGILKTGAGYVPLDPGYPGERLAYMVQDAGLDWIVTSRAHEALAEGLRPL